MPDDSTFFEDGEWSGRVAFSEGAFFAYRPDQIVVPSERRGDVTDRLQGRTAQAAAGEILPDDEDVAGHFRIRNVKQALDAVEELRADGIAASPNHVLFSHCRCCCGPFPALLSGHPFSANPFSANPFSANPFSANPFSANPFSANPFSANASCASTISANPFSANPYSARTFQPNPLLLHAAAEGSPEAQEFRASGNRPHSAHPAEPPDLPTPPADPAEPGPTVVVIDTGIVMPPPAALAGVQGITANSGVTRPNAAETWISSSQPGQIGASTGHGTFIAGIIKMVAPNVALQVQGPLSSRGDISEHDLARVLGSLLAAPPVLLNLSFGGYSAVDMPALGKAVGDLLAAGTIIVASAGNDATCQPAYPAAFPGVIAVGALGPYGPAHFTNFGPWVRACAPGVDVVSTFFDDAMLPSGEDFDGWARWSGTSFATPAVVGALAAAMPSDADVKPKQAVKWLIDDPGLFRIPGLGTVVNQTPRWLRT